MAKRKRVKSQKRAAVKKRKAKTAPKRGTKPKRKLTKRIARKRFPSVKSKSGFPQAVVSSEVLGHDQDGVVVEADEELDKIVDQELNENLDDEQGYF